MGICLGAGTNLILDPLFMGTFNMGIGGAALATKFITTCDFLLLLLSFCV